MEEELILLLIIASKERKKKAKLLSRGAVEIEVIIVDMNRKKMNEEGENVDKLWMESALIVV